MPEFVENKVRIIPAMATDNAHDDLVEQARHDRASFAELYRQFAPRVYRYIYARVGSHPDAEDLTAQTFMAAMQGLGRFRAGGNFSAWLFTIARNKVVDARRHNSRLTALDEDYPLAGTEADPLAQVLAAETAQQLAAVLQPLSNEHKEMLRLRFAAQLSYREIGEVLGKREAAVKMALRRLLSHLQDEMEANHG